MISPFGHSNATYVWFAEHAKDLASRLDRSELVSLYSELRLVNLCRAKRRENNRKVMAMALGASAMQAVLGLRPYEVQYQAAFVMADGCVAEMATGEGKTVAVALAAAVLAAEGHSVHIATANSYLAKRDHALVSRMASCLGLTCGLIENEMAQLGKKQAYQCDIVYGTADAFAFDYLRDRLAKRSSSLQRLSDARQDCSRKDGRLCLRRHHLVIDEIDHVVIDEATTPLILSVPSDRAESTCRSVYAKASQVAARLQLAIDWEIDNKSNRARVTDIGKIVVEKSVPKEPLARPWADYVCRALDAMHLVHRDIDYVVHDKRVMIIDIATGRPAEGRQWQDGLFQAVEYHEGLNVTPESLAAAQISKWRFLKTYHQLSGCSGTAWDCRSELTDIYGLSTVRIPTRLPSAHCSLPTVYTANADEKWNLIVKEIEEIHLTGRPILVGTRTVAESQALAQRLVSLGYCPRVLNGTQEESEADLISMAGKIGAITIATDMAGRGTDIVIADTVAGLGGLHVIVSEPRHSVRLDRQLIGRCARQGQPGTFRTFVAGDDQLVKRYAPGLSRFLTHRLTNEMATEPLWKAVAKAARKSESEMASARGRLAKQEERRDTYFQHLPPSLNTVP